MKLSTRLTLAMVVLVLLTATAVGYFTYRNVEAFALPRGLDRIDTRTRVLAAEREAGVHAARADVHEAIRQGIQDVAQGRTRPAREAFDQTRRRHGIPV